jgi:hypothetical protein
MWAGGHIHDAGPGDSAAFEFSREQVCPPFAFAIMILSLSPTNVHFAKRHHAPLLKQSRF